MRFGQNRIIVSGMAAIGFAAYLTAAEALRDCDDPKQWAFRPVAHVQPPSVPSGLCANPVDCLLRTKQRENGLEPAGPADRRALLRRISFDLTGLPPAPNEIAAWLNDDSPGAYQRLVERLLASPHYGERWGRHWLDVARYADTAGFESDPLYPTAWRYRDYVIKSFNADKPFDRLVQEQVAGDELWPDDRDALIATGMFCVGPALPESAMVGAQLEYEWLTDATDTTGAAFLGLTLGCARCHDHKYDPLTQQDYFAIQAVFAASDRPFPEKIRLNRIKALNGLLSDAPVPKDVLNDPRCTVKMEDGSGLHLFHRNRPLDVHVLKRGELNKPREEVAPGVPAVLSSRPQSSGRARSVPLADVRVSDRRSSLAKWLTSSDNPLTARVIVNRVWGWHFGRGIVRTPNDVGAQGEPPTHPELLDWLSRDFMEHGWSIKHLHRRILLSRAYQMASATDRDTLRVDPENRWLARFPRRRLEGELVRDALLTCAGTLNHKAFGPAVVPPLGKEEMTGLFDAKGKWPVTKDAGEHVRRSVYLLERRTFAYPLFSAFDSPEVMVSCPRRQSTIVPTQALALLNSPLAHEQAAAFARRLERECDNESGRVARAWLLAFGRPITPPEAARATEFLREGNLTELCLALFNANEFIYLD
jgi:hypothetical protein